MNNILRPKPIQQWHAVILGLSAFLGMILRVFPGAMTGFPLNDGGMFYVMIRDLQFNHYLLPLVTTYNHAEIPFAYPPFGFYVAAILHDLAHLPELESLRWVPVIVNGLSIFPFYLLASAILKDRMRAAVASAVYALAPASYDWFIMGGGLTRSLGAFFLLLSLYFLLRTFESETWKNTFITTLFCSLAVLSHPEYGLHTAASCLLFWLFYGRTRQRTMRAAAIGFGTLVLTSPWWFALLLGHGLDPFLSAFHTGLYERNSILSILQAAIAWNSYLPFLMVFRVMGIGWAARKRNFILLAWMALPYFVEPRSAPAIAFYPIAMLTALGVMDALPWLVNRLKKDHEPLSESKALTEVRWFNAVTFILLLSMFLESALFSFRIINTSLKSPALESMIWIKENTPEEARFLILTGKPDAMVDPMQEWFPAITERGSQTTLQGLEWTLSAGFATRYKLLGALQSCRSVQCVEDWSSNSGLVFTHLLVKSDGAPKSLLDSLSKSKYTLIYQSAEYSVYEK